MIYMTGYLAIGALTALMLYFVFDQGIRERDKEPDIDAALREAEKSIGGIPGGMMTTLLLTVVIWPMFWGTYIRSRFKRGDG